MAWPWTKKAAVAPVVPDAAHLREHPKSDYMERTRSCVEMCDCAILVYRGAMTPGTRATYEELRRRGKPVVTVDLEYPLLNSPDVLAAKISGDKKMIMVAGPRESRCPGIYHDARGLLTRVFQALGV